jgi:hypothetical protein
LNFIIETRRKIDKRGREGGEKEFFFFFFFLLEKKKRRKEKDQPPLRLTSPHLSPHQPTSPLQNVTTLSLPSNPIYTPLQRG